MGYSHNANSNIDPKSMPIAVLRRHFFPFAKPLNGGHYGITDVPVGISISMERRRPVGSCAATHPNRRGRR